MAGNTVELPSSNLNSHCRSYCGYPFGRGHGNCGNDTSGFEVMLSDFAGADKVYIA